jgi:1-phosphatidylinositol phosphodiesterase
MPAHHQDLSMQAAAAETGTMPETTPTPASPYPWMSHLPDATLLSDINLPGTHDSAAISTYVTTPYACQNETIMRQLERGIRLLDIRLKARWRGANTLALVTCHGKFGGGTWDYNEYQSFRSVLDECTNFLAVYRTETVVMILKFDDWGDDARDQDDPVDNARKQEARAELQYILSLYPTLRSNAVPQLSDARGKIVLFNRVTKDLRFGTPVGWPNNTGGAYAHAAASTKERSYKIYVQDRYENPSASDKLKCVWDAALQKKAGEVSLNFVSAVRLGLLGLYIGGDLLAKFGELPAADRPKKFGWMLFDYPFAPYHTDNYDRVVIVNFIIASNFGYAGYEHEFTVGTQLSD